MKHYLLSHYLLVLIAVIFTSWPALAQRTDSLGFRGYLYNKEYDVFMRIDFYKSLVVIPGQEVFGTMPGYLSKVNTSYCWMVTSAEFKDDSTAILEMTNDYGSEDLVAELSQTSDSTFTLLQLKGSTLKVAQNRKWLKLPRELQFVRRRQKQ